MMWATEKKEVLTLLLEPSTLNNISESKKQKGKIDNLCDI
jgi:hypothetical protein